MIKAIRSFWTGDNWSCFYPTKTTRILYILGYRSTTISGWVEEIRHRDFFDEPRPFDDIKLRLLTGRTEKLQKPSIG